VLEDEVKEGAAVYAGVATLWEMEFPPAFRFVKKGIAEDEVEEKVPAGLLNVRAPTDDEALEG